MPGRGEACPLCVFTTTHSHTLTWPYIPLDLPNALACPLLSVSLSASDTHIHARALVRSFTPTHIQPHPPTQRPPLPWRVSGRCTCLCLSCCRHRRRVRRKKGEEAEREPPSKQSQGLLLPRHHHHYPTAAMATREKGAMEIKAMEEGGGDLRIKVRVLAGASNATE